MTKNNQPIDALTLCNTPLPPVRWIVPELLPAGLTLLAGASKAGKSWMCLWLGIQLARGGSAVWGRSVPPQTVLYLCLEDTLSRIQSRLFHLLGEEAPPQNLYLDVSGQTIGDGLEEQLERFLFHRPDTALVIIDTLQKVRGGQQAHGVYGADYNDMSALKRLADRHNLCILLVHHLRKQSAEDPFCQISGSNGLMGAADTIWLLQKQRQSSTAKLRVTGRDMDSRALTLQLEGCVWQLLEEESSEQLETKAVPEYLWRIADFIAGQGGWSGTATELLATTGIADVPPNQLTRKLAEHFHAVFTPRGIEYKLSRTAKERLLEFAVNDSSDDDDGSKGIQDTPEPSSLSSSSSLGKRLLEDNKCEHCVVIEQSHTA